MLITRTSVPAVGPCLLCLRADRPMTREHVFARWLVDRVRGAQLVPSHATGGPTAPMRISRVTAAACADCNAGWMSALEDSFRRAVFARPRLGAIQAADRSTISRWFAKTALLLAHVHGGPIAGVTHGAQLVGGLPDDLEVFFARRRRPPQRLDFAVHQSADGTPRSVAIVVDDLVGHVAARGTLASPHGTQLWPLRSHVLRWETLPVVTSLRPTLRT
jgi:hypothetical protein